MRVVELSGGVGGAKLARGLVRVPGIELTVVVNVGDDASNHGLHVSPDLDTVIYTMAGMEGEHGWGRGEDTFVANDELGRFGMDNTFRLGDKDLALKLYRTERMQRGDRLSAITVAVAKAFDITARVLPATDDRLRTEVGINAREWLTFQDYFVLRGHQDEVRALRFSGADNAVPAPGVIEAIDEADVILIGPSNPPLSIWPILAVPGIRTRVGRHPRVTAVSPLFGGKALKGPADQVMTSLGLAAGNAGVSEAYSGLIDTLVIDTDDRIDIESIHGIGVRALDTRMPDWEAAARLSAEILQL